MSKIRTGRFIEKTRKEKGITKEALAANLGVSQRDVSRWEKGVSRPAFSLYEPLCGVLDVQLAELLKGRRLSPEEKAAHSEETARNLLAARSHMDTLAVFAELLIVAGVLIAITLTGALAVTIPEIVITLLSGAFVLGIGLALRLNIRKAMLRLEQR